MALTRFNYQPGQFEACTDETLTPASPVLNTWYNFEIGDWKHAISDVVLKQSGSPIPESAYELAIDTKYTTREAGESGKTVYAKWRIVNATYDEIATTVSGNNFGTYIDNAKLDSRLDALEAFDAALDAEAVPYDNSTSGLSATDVQAAIDEVDGLVDAIPVSTLSTGTVLLNGSNTSATFTGNFLVTGGTPNGTNILEQAVQISIARPASTSYTVNYYISPSISGAETGSTSWWNPITRTSGQGSLSIYVKLQPGLYRLHIVQSSATGSDVTAYTITQKTITPGLTW